jgi:hypothetical protein
MWSERRCNLNCMNHEHKFFLFKHITTFEPTENSAAQSASPVTLYERAEYAVLSCNCGQAIKTRIKEGEDGQ